MAALAPAWPEFVAMVEGRESAESCVLVDGIPAIHFKRNPTNAEPNLGILAELLRSEAEIPGHIRAWIADMLDESAGSYLRLVARRRSGRPLRPVDSNWDAVEHFEKLTESTNRKTALDATMAKFGMSRSALESAIARYRDALAVAAQIDREESPKK